MDGSKRKRRTYTDGERTAILRDAEQLGVVAAAKRHGIAASTVSNWRNRGGAATTAIAAAQSTKVASALAKTDPSLLARNGPGRFPDLTEPA